MVIFKQVGNTIGLNDKDNGHIGAIDIDATSFYIIGPPADKKYAVEPVGVDTIIPSPEATVSKTSLMYISIYKQCGLAPLDITNSFRTWYTNFSSSFSFKIPYNLNFLSTTNCPDVLKCSIYFEIISYLFFKSNTHINPKVPFIKANIGGGSDFWNYLNAYNTVPSPPTTKTKAINGA